MRLNAWMRETRSRKQLTMQHCAECAGVKQPTWAEWETNPDLHPRQSTVEKIALGLDEPVSLVTRYAYPQPPTSAADEAFIQEIDSELLLFPVDSRPRVKRAIVEMTRTMRKTLTAA
jgi:transcriptional regulator with XRE-family HTH domain